MEWSPAQYTKFEAERNRPVRDLLAQIPTAKVSSAVDIGCGPGNSTELLQERFPEAVITGMDSSVDMLDAARKRLPDIQFEIGDIGAWRNPGPFDVILANAALHWVPDHESLLPALIAKLAPGGSLAVQIPDNLDEPSHHAMREVATDEQWADKLSGAAHAATRHDPDWYYRVLRSCAAKLDIWRTIYFHPLAGPAAITEWFKGTGLRPFLDPLNTIERASFLARYQEVIAHAYPALEDGTVVLPFPRLFFVAAR
jgi:trans-aconitate 2-methyltransferase